MCCVEKSAGVPVKATPASAAPLAAGRNDGAGSGVASRIESCGPDTTPAGSGLSEVAILCTVRRSDFFTPPHELEISARSLLAPETTQAGCEDAFTFGVSKFELSPAAASWLGANTDAATGLSAMRGFAELNGLRFARSALMGATAK